MASIVAVLSQNILPIFVVASFGFALEQWVGVDKKMLSKAVLYVMSPCLVFVSLANSQLPGQELGQLALFATLNVLLMGLIGLGAARLLRLSRMETVALVIVVMFVNGGNYGLTLNQLRYGDEGLARAVVYYTTSTIITYTLGLLIASMGKLSWRDALRRLLRLPPLYAAVLAVFVYLLNIPIPAPLMRGLEVAGDGAIPVLLLVLGMQLASMRGTAVVRTAFPIVALRLIVGPLVGVLLAGLIGLEGLGRATSIIESSMPTAVMMIVLATEFDVAPPLVTSAVVLSTLLSPLSVAVVITLFGL